MLRVGLTGGIATGKTYVRGRFEALGVPTIDADVLARQVVAPGTEGLAAVVARFGPEVLDAEGRLHRARLAAVVFPDASARQALEAIVHPRVYAAIQTWLAGLAETGSARLALADIPLLFETGHAGDFDVVVVTACPREMQIARIMARDGTPIEAARLRLAAQWPIEEKERQADYVIRTDGTYADTDAQVDTVYGALRQRAERAGSWVPPRLTRVERS